MKTLIKKASKFIFFTGKGGVGKTSLSCATALMLADQGKKVLLVSTDPASNLDQVLEVKLNDKPTRIDGTKTLMALNIDPRNSAAQYRECVVGPYRGVLPDVTVKEMEEQLSGACTVEIAAFDEFSRLMTDVNSMADFDHIIFDTAPTGHTLRLLQLPAAWKGYLDSSSGNASCLGPLSGLKGHHSQFEMTLNTLTDSNSTLLVLVTRPDTHAITEAQRTSIELSKLGVLNQQLAINGLLENNNKDDATAEAMQKRQSIALKNMPSELQKLSRIEIPLSPNSLIGINALRTVFEKNTVAQISDKQIENELKLNGEENISTLINSLDAQSGVIMTMGKGGVGKTTMASLIAVELSKRGRKVHLTTSDPAAHLDMQLSKQFPNLKVSRIDPLAETELYRKEVLQQAGGSLDKEGRRMLEEDLRSPCTEEIAVFRAFAHIIDEAKDSIVVMDTAPTGHTILLLDATEAYHREVSRNRSTVPEEVKKLLPRIRDKVFTKILIVTLPEATPVQEALDLKSDLERAGISPFAWIVNQSLIPLPVKNSVLIAKRSNEFQYIKKVKDISEKMAVVPWQELNANK